MVFITGDTHYGKEMFDKFKTSSFPEQKTLTKEDIVIVLGDFGAITWDNSKETIYNREWLTDKPFQTVFVDGNHCNFDYLNSLPIKVWNGGKVGVIETKNGEIYHLKRGEIYTIEGKTFLVIGGATSTDKEHRIPNISWWKEEELSKDDENNAINNLDKVGWKVDYVLTHTCPQWIGNEIYSRYHYPCSVQTFLNFIENRLDYKHWFFGHYHYDLEGIRKDFTCLYHSIKQLEE